MFGMFPGSRSLPVRCPAHLLPSWKRANSRAARSNTVSDVTVTGPLALLGNMPCTRTSCQSEWSLQISTESKYLWGSWAQRWRAPLWVRCSGPTPQHAAAHAAGSSWHQELTRIPLGTPSPACPTFTPVSHFLSLPTPQAPASWALPYLMKSLYSIQKTPSLLPWGIRS